MNNTQQVDEYLEKLDHPFKVEVQAIRDLIKGVNKKITEEVKWNAPAFSYKDYIATFNLWEKKRVHLIFHNPEIVNIKSDILEGDYTSRRMVYFSDMKDVKAKKADLIKVVKELIKVLDEKVVPDPV